MADYVEVKPDIIKKVYPPKNYYVTWFFGWLSGFLLAWGLISLIDKKWLLGIILIVLSINTMPIRKLKVRVKQ